MVLTSTGVAMSIEKANIMTGHHDEEQEHKIALELGESLQKRNNDAMQSLLNRKS